MVHHVFCCASPFVAFVLTPNAYRHYTCICSTCMCVSMCFPLISYQNILNNVSNPTNTLNETQRKRFQKLVLHKKTSSKELFWRGWVVRYIFRLCVKFKVLKIPKPKFFFWKMSSTKIKKKQKKSPSSWKFPKKSLNFQLRILLSN